ncbi:MAG: hypothetical protein AABY89_07725 [Acidobacteriota bacterium]
MGSERVPAEARPKLLDDDKIVNSSRISEFSIHDVPAVAEQVRRLVHGLVFEGR